MAIENLTGVLPNEVVNQISLLIRIFQAIGGLIIAYIIFNVIQVIINRKKKNHMKRIAVDIKEIKKLLQKEIKNKK